jgi:undecaprenyl diphosphate synthase
MGIIARLKGLRATQRPQGPFFGEDGPSPDRIPRHVAIIMDGNGRWASRRRLPAAAGHREGTRALKRTVEASIEAGIRQLTVYSFSTENWNRPEDEVRGLMELLEEMIEREAPVLHEQGVRLTFVGSRGELAPGIVRRFEEAEALTAENEVMDLFVAFNYGGRQEIVDAVRLLVGEGVEPSAIDEKAISAHMYVPWMADPDLIIRTSGELRLSNFLLWESAYSELYFSPLMWPDFGSEELRRALVDYASRERRFGKRQAGGLA